MSRIAVEALSRISLAATAGNALGTDHKATANTMRLLSAITLLTAAQALRPLAPLRKLTSKLRKAPVVQAAPSGASLKPYLSQLIEGEDLNKDDAKGLFGAFLDGSASPEQVAAVLCCLRQKGETRTKSPARRKPCVLRVSL